MTDMSYPKNSPRELRAKLFRGFADPSRLSVLEALLETPQSVSAIVESTGLSQPNVSNHLACLKDCGLVVGEERGRFSYYRLADTRVKRLLRDAQSILGNVAKRIEACPRYEAGTIRDGKRTRARPELRMRRR